MTTRRTVMAKDKIQEIDTTGFTFIESKEIDGKTVTVYARAVPFGCDKRTIVTKNGTVESDDTEFKVAAYIQEWIKNGKPFRHELIGG